jgi:hypothetical protein
MSKIIVTFDIPNIHVKQLYITSRGGLIVPDLTLKEAFDIYQKQSDSIHKIWAYFQMISVAVLGYTIGSNKDQWGAETYCLIAGSYLLFAIANQAAIIFSQKELYKFGYAVKVAAENSGVVGKQLVIETIMPWKVALFHTLATTVILAAIFVTWHDKSSKAASNPITKAEIRMPTCLSKM